MDVLVQVMVHTTNHVLTVVNHKDLLVTASATA